MLWYSCTNWNWFVLKSNRIKIINDMNKLIREEVKAMYFIVFMVSLLLTTIESIPIIGTKTKDDNNMCKI